MTLLRALPVTTQVSRLCRLILKTPYRMSIPKLVLWAYGIEATAFADTALQMTDPVWSYVRAGYSLQHCLYGLDVIQVAIVVRAFPAVIELTAQIRAGYAPASRVDETGINRLHPSHPMC